MLRAVTKDGHKMAAQHKKKLERVQVLKPGRKLTTGYKNNPIQHLLFAILMLINIDFYI